MKLKEILKESSIRDLPRKFDSGDDFMEFVYDKWPSAKTHVELQGGGAWSAEIHGDKKIKAANYDEETGEASWLNSDYREILDS